MPRILGVDIPHQKRIEVSLTYIFGIGLKTSQRILNTVGIDLNRRAHELTEDEISQITKEIQKTTRVEGDLRREVSGNIRRLIDIGSYRGQRHKRGLPVRGQRSRTNARSRKGPRPRVGVRKKARV
jgi:small subunit ribosomal protein S13